MAKFACSDFMCTKCGKKVFPIWRREGRFHEGGHLKKLYCINCRQENNCVEITEFSDYSIDDFRFEFEHHNFVDGNRQMTLKQLKAKERRRIHA